MPDGSGPDYRHITFGSGARIDRKSGRVREGLAHVTTQVERSKARLEEVRRKLEEFRKRRHRPE